MKAAIILFSIFILLSFSVLAQDKINLESGQIIEGKIKEINNNEVIIEVIKKTKTKTIFVEKERIFSIYTPEKGESVFFEASPEEGLSEDEVRFFVYGAQDAIAKYKGTVPFISSLILGSGGGYYAAQSLVVFAVPFATVIVVSIFTSARANKHHARDEAFLDHEMYRRGYKRVARGKKAVSALKGSVLGTLAGVGAYYIIL
jgi:hypothetical protein